jgi:hypothetical protein
LQILWTEESKDFLHWVDSGLIKEFLSFYPAIVKLNDSNLKILFFDVLEQVFSNIMKISQEKLISSFIKMKKNGSYDLLISTFNDVNILSEKISFSFALCLLIGGQPIPEEVYFYFYCLSSCR